MNKFVIILLAVWNMITLPCAFSFCTVSAADAPKENIEYNGDDLSKIEKVRLDSMDRAKRQLERDRARLEKERQKKEKDQLDSLKNAHKEQTQTSRRGQKEEMDAERRREMEIRDSIIAASEAERKRTEELEQRRLEREREDELKRQALATAEEAERQRKAAEFAERQRQIRIAEEKRIEQEQAAARLREQEERERLVRLEQERLEKIRREQEERRRLEQIEEEQERIRVQTENMRKNEIIAKENPVENQTPYPYESSEGSSTVLPRASSPQEMESSSPYQAKAQKYISEIYALLEENKPDLAYLTFQRTRNDIARFTPPEIFSTLEMTVMEMYLEYQNQKRSVQPAYTGSQTYETYSPKPSTDEERAEKEAARIGSLINFNKIEQAYNAFIKNKPELKKHLDKSEFKKLEQRVMNSYKLISR